MSVLGLTSFIHTSSASLVSDQGLVAAADQERFSRLKHDGRFPKDAIEYCLREGGLSLSDLEAVAFYWRPWDAVAERIWQLVSNMPRSLAFFRRQRQETQAVRGDFCAWRNMVLLRRILARNFAGQRVPPITYVEHHLAHAASSFFASPFDESLILTIDGTGEWHTTMESFGRGNTIEKRNTVGYPHSLGVVYGAATQFLGQLVYHDEWKVMGLASYGKPRYADLFRTMISLTNDGWFRLDLRYFNFQLADKDKWYSPRWTDLFGPARRLDEAIEQDRFADLAASVQTVLEETVVHIVRAMIRRSRCRKLCLAGGVCLNSVMNARILEQTDIQEIFVQPAANDPGAALGAALYVQHQLLGKPRKWAMHHASWGPGFTADDCLQALHNSGLAYTQPADIVEPVAEELDKGKVVGWFQGRMEFGPRALGNRSILADPRRAEMKDIINAKVKYREAYRPFAPSVLEERCSEYFDRASASPFMLLVFPVKPGKRSQIPAVTHVDGTGRVQTVSREHNALFHRLISRFCERTGVPVLLNTSFNIKGEPIVCSPRDAVRCFLKCGLDALALGPFFIKKT